MCEGRIGLAKLAASGQGMRWETLTIAAQVWNLLAVGMIAAACAAEVNPLFTKAKSILIFR
jgi:hypothetical protein